MSRFGTGANKVRTPREAKKYDFKAWRNKIKHKTLVFAATAFKKLCFFFQSYQDLGTQHFASEDAGKSGIALRLHNFGKALAGEINHRGIILFQFSFGEPFSNEKRA